MEIFNERFEGLKKVLNTIKIIFSKGDLEKIRPRLLKLVELSKTEEEINYLINDKRNEINILKRRMEAKPEEKDKIQAHIDWLNTTYSDALKKKKKELKDKKLNEGITIPNNRIRLIEETIFLGQSVSETIKFEKIRNALCELKDILVSLTSYDKKINTRIDENNFTGYLTLSDIIPLDDGNGFKSKFKNSIESQLGLLNITVEAVLDMEDDDNILSINIKVYPSEKFNFILTSDDNCDSEINNGNVI